MPRYVAIRQQKKPARSDYCCEPYGSIQPLGQPMVCDTGPVDTGLLDKDGNRIFRAPDPIGFVERK